MIRTAWVALIGVVGTAFFGSLVILGSVIGVRRQGYYDWIGRTWAGLLMRASGCPVRVEGLENVPFDEPRVLVGNHQSWLDVLSVAANMPGTFHFVAKKELEGIFLFGRAWKSAGHISIDRSDRAAAIASLEQAGRQLQRERGAVIIFPEGTRSPTDRLLPFKKGAFMLAMHTGVPIVPFGVAGSRRAFPKGSWRVRKAPIILRFGPPIPTRGLDESDREDLMRRVRDEVRRLRDEGRRELGPGRLEALPPPAPAPDAEPGTTPGPEAGTTPGPGAGPRPEP